MLSSKPVAVATTLRSGSSDLPTATGAAEVTSRTDRAYVTSDADLQAELERVVAAGLDASTARCRRSPSLQLHPGAHLCAQTCPRIRPRPERSSRPLQRPQAVAVGGILQEAKLDQWKPTPFRLHPTAS